MDSYKLQHFRSRLLEEKEELENLEENFEKHGLNEPMDVAATELSAYDQHPADYGSQMYERSKDIGLRETTRRQLQAVDDALEAIKTGNYGYCQKCRQPIDYDRLEALPATELCIECKREEEKNQGDLRERPVEEDVLNTPFARTDKDNSDYTGFDGEDAWQAVAKFGTSNAPQDVPGSVEYGEVYIDAQEDVGSVTDVEEIADEETERE